MAPVFLNGCCINLAKDTLIHKDVALLQFDPHEGSDLAGIQHFGDLAPIFDALSKQLYVIDVVKRVVVEYIALYERHCYEPTAQ